MIQRVSTRAKHALTSARQIAANRRDSTISAAHLLAALLDDTTGAHVHVLSALGVRAPDVKAAIGLERCGEGPSDGKQPPVSDEAKRAIHAADSVARRLGHNYVGTEHLLYGVIECAPTSLSAVLRHFGLTAARVQHVVEHQPLEVWVQESNPLKGATCKKCGYDMRASAKGLCPECGSPNAIVEAKCANPIGRGGRRVLSAARRCGGPFRNENAATSKLNAPRFIVSINGEQRCIAGLDGDGVLSVILSAHVGSEDDPDYQTESLIHCTADLRVGGLQRRDHLDWLAADLYVADEVTIRVAEGGAFDPPTIAPKKQSFVCGSGGDYRAEYEARRMRFAKAGNLNPARFQAIANGNIVGTAGIRSGVLCAYLTYTRRDPKLRPASSSEAAEDWMGGTIDFRMGGLENDVHLEWCRAHVDVGDEITIRVLGPGPVDQPEGRHENRPIPHDGKRVVAGRRVSLRLLVADDLEFVAATLRGRDASGTRADAEEWLQKHIDSPSRYRTMYVIIDNDSHASVGLCGILEELVDGQSLATVQCMIVPEHRRKGYATCAVETCIEIVHNPASWADEKPSDAFALIQPKNDAGLALARKVGMAPARTVQFNGSENLLHVSVNRSE